MMLLPSIDQSTTREVMSLSVPTPPPPQSPPHTIITSVYLHRLSAQSFPQKCNISSVESLKDPHYYTLTHNETAHLSWLLTNVF